MCFYTKWAQLLCQHFNTWHLIFLKLLTMLMSQKSELTHPTETKSFTDNWSPGLLQNEWRFCSQFSSWEQTLVTSCGSFSMSIWRYSSWLTTLLKASPLACGSHSCSPCRGYPTEGPSGGGCPSSDASTKTKPSGAEDTGTTGIKLPFFSTHTPHC